MNKLLFLIHCAFWYFAWIRLSQNGIKKDRSDAEWAILFYGAVCLFGALCIPVCMVGNTGAPLCSFNDVIYSDVVVGIIYLAIKQGIQMIKGVMG